MRQGLLPMRQGLLPTRQERAAEEPGSAGEAQPTRALRRARRRRQSRRGDGPLRAYGLS